MAAPIFLFPFAGGNLSLTKSHFGGASKIGKYCRTR